MLKLFALILIIVGLVSTHVLPDNHLESDEHINEKPDERCGGGFGGGFRGGFPGGFNGGFPGGFGGGFNGGFPGGFGGGFPGGVGAGGIPAFG
ncbi:uncharacterized protein LOC128961071 [Oppia nitens]|uniref:uncharacterized protein LOC128961071 n=1 Tax=Oppia nitens TaxID=1686743 RepID=UPI0023DC8C45|nr:uncharacterized protein LOC128961071 [Oppia nitens]